MPIYREKRAAFRDLWKVFSEFPLLRPENPAFLCRRRLPERKCYPCDNVPPNRRKSLVKTLRFRGAKQISLQKRNVLVVQNVLHGRAVTFSPRKTFCEAIPLRRRCAKRFAMLRRNVFGVQTSFLGENVTFSSRKTFCDPKTKLRRVCKTVCTAKTKLFLPRKTFCTPETKLFLLCKTFFSVARSYQSTTYKK